MVQGMQMSLLGSNEPTGVRLEYPTCKMHATLFNDSQACLCENAYRPWFSNISPHTVAAICSSRRILEDHVGNTRGEEGKKHVAFPTRIKSE